MFEPLRIRSYRHTYTAQFVADYAPVLTEQLRRGDHVVIDANILKLHPRLQPCIESCSATITTPSEQAKSYDAVAPVIQQLIACRFTRVNRLFAIGGGIVQDITAFVASIFLRGVDWVFFPTNLLAQCDSCIGSKTSINFGAYKNQLGGFFPPKAIYIDVAFLATLPSREICSGLGEMMHYFLVNGEDDLAWAEERVPRAFSSPDTLQEMIHHSLVIKKAMIEQDEFDQGPRNVFNYGHSFGHALESATDYQVPHGIAVSYGMDLANLISVSRRLLPVLSRNRIRRVLARIWSDAPLPAVDLERFVAALARDKKNEGAAVKVILTRGPGDMFKETLVLDQETRDLVARFFSEKLYAQEI